jgi:ABC-type polysaccharide/polyol phosphate transport system ATPase subunit
MNQNKEPIVEVKGLWKTYKLFSRPSQRLWHYCFKLNTGQDFHALHDINFTVYKGETFGIIGKNGSGKSTVLQILAGIITPSKGEINIRGKIAALLELGSGFNPENTGFENIYMNAAILGLGKKEIEKKILQIVEFADIGDFIDRQVKTYSSGMYVRLAFAVAINIDADVILIDEALAVGDIFFRQKCYARLNQLKNEGKSIILVTHSMNEIEQFCDRALLLDHSRQLALDRSSIVVKQYYLLSQEDVCLAYKGGSTTDDRIGADNETVSHGQIVISEFDGWTMRENIFFDLKNSKEISNGKARFIQAGLFNRDGMAARVFEQGDEAFFYARIEVLEDVEVPAFGVLIVNHKNIILTGKASSQTYCDVPLNVKKGSIVTAIEHLILNLEPGEMTIEYGFVEYNKTAFMNRAVIPNEELFMNENKICIRSKIGVFAIIQKKIGNPTRLTHYGVCDLPARFLLSVSE